MLFDAFFESRNWRPALVLADELVARQRQVERLHRSLIVTPSNMKCYDEAIVRALKVARFYTGRTDEAVYYGQRAPDLRDAEACRGPPAMDAHEPSGRAGQNVISFSRWGRGHQRYGLAEIYESVEKKCGTPF